MASHASKNLVVHLAITNIKILGSDSFLKCFLFVDNNKIGLLIVLLRLVNSIHTPNSFSTYHHFLINFREKLFIKKLNINYRPFCPVFEYRCVLFGPQNQRNSGKYTFELKCIRPNSRYFIRKQNALLYVPEIGTEGYFVLFWCFENGSFPKTSFLPFFEKKTNKKHF